MSVPKTTNMTASSPLRLHTYETKLLSIEQAGRPIYTGKRNSTNAFEHTVQLYGGKPF